MPNKKCIDKDDCNMAKSLAQQVLYYQTVFTANLVVAYADSIILVWGPVVLEAQKIRVDRKASSTLREIHPALLENDDAVAGDRDYFINRDGHDPCATEPIADTRRMYDVCACVSSGESDLLEGFW